MLVFWGPPTTGSISPQAGTQLGRVRHHWLCCDGLRELERYLYEVLDFEARVL